MRLPSNSLDHACEVKTVHWCIVCIKKANYCMNHALALSYFVCKTPKGENLLELMDLILGRLKNIIDFALLTFGFFGTARFGADIKDPRKDLREKFPVVHKYIK